MLYTAFGGTYPIVSGNRYPSTALDSIDIIKIKCLIFLLTALNDIDHPVCCIRRNIPDSIQEQISEYRIRLHRYYKNQGCNFPPHGTQGHRSSCMLHSE